MEESGGFQSQFSALMDSVLQTAVAEATRLFERTLHQLKAELLHLRQENVDLKSGLYTRQLKTRHTGDASQRSDPSPGPPRCDAEVQCEKPLMVERCCSPAQFGEHPLQLQHITSDSLADLCSNASEDGNRQLALLLIKKEPQEADCDDYAPGYFLLKQEGAEPILVRKEPFKNTLERVTLPSKIQTVTRCCEKNKEISVATTVSTTNVTSTSNSVSCGQRVDSSTNKITPTTQSTTTLRGLTPPSDKDGQTSSTSPKTSPTVPEQTANSPQSSIPASTSTTTVSLSSTRTHPTAPTVSLQSNRLPEPQANLSTPQSQQIVKNIQRPVAGSHLSPQPVRLPFSQRQNLGTNSRSSIRSYQASVATTDKRVPPALLRQTVTPRAQPCTQPIRHSLPPVESVIPRHKRMTKLGHFPGPRVQTQFSPGQRTLLSGQAPKPLSQHPPNHVTNPPVQGQIPSFPGPVSPFKGPGAHFPRVRGSLPPVQGRVLPTKGPAPPVQTPLPPVQGLLPLAQGSVPPHPGQRPLVQTTLPSMQSRAPPIHGPVPQVQTPLPSVQGLLPPSQGSVPPYTGQRLPVHGSVPTVQGSIRSGQGSVPPHPGQIPPVQNSVPTAQGLVPPNLSQQSHVQNPVSSVPGPVLPIQPHLPPVQGLPSPNSGQHPHGQSPVSSIQSPVSSVQNQISSIHSSASSIQGLVPPIHLPVPPAHAQVYARSNENLPPHSQSFNIQSHFPSVPHHHITPSTQPFYPQTQIPFTQSYIPPQSSAAPATISQTNAPSPLDKTPVTTSHYQMLSDSLCSSSDQFFPPPDSTLDLPPMPFQSPIVLTQQEAALEQPSMVQSQTSEQPLQLAPLLTLKEQQLAASNQGNVPKRVPSMPVDIIGSGVSNFEEPIQRFLPCSGQTINCEGKDFITNEMHNDNSNNSKNEQDSSTALTSGVREHYMVLSKPEPNSSSRIPQQSSGQSLQLAPLLTQKEQQAATGSNQGSMSKGGPAVPGDIMMSGVNNLGEHMPNFLPGSGPTINCEGNESITNEIFTEDFSENDQDSHVSFMPEEHYKVFSKPEPNFRGIEGPQIDSEVSDKNLTGCNTAGVVWESTDSSSTLPHSALSASAPSRAHTLQKASRRVLERNTECSECGRILSNASSLQNHMRLHRGERPYNCSQCGKAFPSVRGLNRHMKVHAAEKGYKCEECGRCFVYQFTLTKHKLIHSGDRPYPCKICGKKFLAKADRTTHMRMHTGEKPFYCTQCGKSFKHRVALNMHLQGHKGEKRYVCPHCDKGFVDLGNFKRHKRIHTGEKPFECKACGKRFTQSAHLKKHANTQHAVSKINPP
ncbi:hypothetical protein AMEX_G10104 [Astyanax mexicanus]|uniref:C2H2-type domain-containing protein n=1 Tax=Astyanax mexicanus TaxID=7994 RepID=A0A8B9LSD9_ASTMX|nr:hypothetical protein AMEX_G10104 [Astyanax mexicanus]